MTSVNIKDAWKEIAQGRLALQRPPDPRVVAYPVYEGEEGLDAHATRAAHGMVFFEVLTDNFRDAGDPDEGTYTVLCFERDAMARLCGVSLHQATAEEIDRVRRRSYFVGYFGTMTATGEHAYGVEPAVVHDNGDYYAALYRVNFRPRVDAAGNLAREAAAGDVVAECYVPVRIDKAERVDGPFGFLREDVQDAGGIVTVRELLAAVERAGYTREVQVRTLRRKKTVVAPPSEPEPVLPRPDALRQYAFAFETDEGRGVAGMYVEDRIAPVPLDPLARSALFQHMRESRRFVQAGNVWIRRELAPFVRIGPDGRVYLAESFLS